uniref:ACB domain-containing protein n=1 Tax=Fagus sylvatica TaxID=28930 RepID=A0A2N9ELY4_FAGSY
MELVQELLVTASLTLILSFFVAKLVSMAMASGSGHDSPLTTTRKNVAEEIVMEEIQFQERLTVQNFQTEMKQFEGEPLQSEEIMEVTKIPGEKIIESPEKSPEVVGLPEELSEEKIVEERLEKREEVEESVSEKEVVEEISEESNSSEEDDWEGIERSELEKAFAAAAKFVVDKEEGLVGVENDVQLELYGLHKVATEGPCRDPQPMPLKLSARAKWNAWQRLGNMNPDVAMEQYINLLSDRVPGWMEDKFAGDIKPESSEAGVSSTVAESSEAGISSTVAPDTTAVSQHQPDYIDERKLEQKSGAEGGDRTGGSNLEDKV